MACWSWRLTGVSRTVLYLFLVRNLTCVLVGFDFVFAVRPSVHVVHVNVPDLTEMFRPGIAYHLTKALQTSSVPIKALILCNPCNPLGQCYTRGALEECLRFCQKENLHFISDEIYALSVFDSPDVVSPVPFISAMSLDVSAVGCDMARVHTVWSVSKDFGSSGLRLVRMGCLFFLFFCLCKARTNR